MKTEWGYEDSFGFRSVNSLETAETIVGNMTKAGIDAKVVWRGVTEWQDRDTLDD